MEFIIAIYFSIMVFWSFLFCFYSFFYNLQMHKVFHFFQRTIKSCNVFTSPVNLRYKEDPDYNTFAGGVVSIILILLLMSIFFGSWMALLNKTDISSSTQIIRQFDPSYLKVTTNDFMFAIGVNGIDLTDLTQKRYFDLTMSRVQMSRGQSFQINEHPFPLEPCTVGHWEQFGQQFVETYKRQDINQFLCPQKNISIETEGKWTSSKFTYLSIKFKKCTGNNCHTQTEVRQWIDAQSSFFFNFFYTNILLNPDQTKPISMFLEDKDYQIFSPTLGTASNIYLAEYIMETDESIFPWIQKRTDRGYIINRAENQVLNYSPGAQDSYCELVLRKSNLRLEIQRKFRKLDDMLSYVGGLFGIIAVAVGVVMKYYGQCSFELQMCQKIFDYNKIKHNQDLTNKSNQTQSGIVSDINIENPLENKTCSERKKSEDKSIIQPRDFGFLDFFLHILVYVPLRKFCNIKWKRMKLYEESLEEMRQKLDIGHLMEKLSFYDRSINALFDESQLKLLYLQEKFNFHDVRNERKMFNLRDGLVANLFDINGESDDDEEQAAIPEQKKTLKEIAHRSNKRMMTYIAVKPVVNLLEELTDYEDQGKLKRKNSKGINLPIDIKKALAKLDSNIKKGDVVSTRIYNNLQYELLEAYENNKENDQNKESSNNKGKHVRSKSKEFESRPKLRVSGGMKEYADYTLNPTPLSLNQMISNQYE